ncbi:MAG: type 4a pilus biogenesis protein PilO [Candidatus Omnitrophica bacterium]|nr:type 4a pilus biogenesis protein PilO [Candidatus Omnitrophota bacterium]
MIRLNLSRRERYVFIVAVAFLGLAIVYGLVFRPFFRKWRSLDSEIIAKSIEFKKGLRLLKDKDVIIDQYNTYARSLKGMSEILGYIEKEADSSGIKTANIRPSPAIQQGLYKEYVIELQLEGDFSAINRFAAGLIKSPAYISIKKFDLRGTGEVPSRLKGTLILSKPII